MKKITIKEIAKEAGVSVGTVDRVLHDRGDVSTKTKELVLAIAKKGNYTTNVFARNLKLNKSYEIAVILPLDNEYWETQKRGIEEAGKSYSSLGLDLRFFSFDRNNQDSFVAVCNEAVESNPAGVILAPLMEIEARAVCKTLEARDIPFVFVDSNLVDASPLAFIGQNTVRSGYLAAKLLNFGFEEGHTAWILKYTDFDSLNKTLNERTEGFKKYYSEQGWDMSLIHELDLRHDMNFEEELPAIGQDDRLHLFIPNSRVYQVMALLQEAKFDGATRALGYDTVSLNIEALKNETVDFIINQNPYQQGFKSVQTLYEHLILNATIEAEQYMPLEIITKENYEYAG